MKDLQRKLGRYAIPNLTTKLFVLNAIGMLLQAVSGTSGLISLLRLDPYLIIHKFQVWRLVTWILIPSTSSFIMYALMAFLFYIPIGRQMESVWGDAKYNAYLFLGFLYTIIATFLVYGFYGLQIRDEATLAALSAMISGPVTPYYVMFSIAFAFAVTFPNVQILFMFLIPIKMKWLGIFWGANLAYDIIRINTMTGLPAAFKVSYTMVIVASVLNFIVFWLMGQRMNLWRMKPSEVKRRADFKRSVHMNKKDVIHRCVVCGRTENDNPELEFRFCSKCSGGKEYCSDHLFTHEHS